MVQINQEIFGPGTVATSDDAVTMGLQAATHWDALTHVSHSREDLQRPPRRHHHRARRRRSSAASTRPRHIVSRGVLLDVARARGVDRLPGDHAVTPEDLDAAEEFGGRHASGPATSSSYGPGRCRSYLAGDKHAYGYPSPGLSLRTPEWFHARDVAAVANDTLTFEIFPPEIEDLWLPVHALDLVEMGMLQGQNWNLEELSTACAEEGRYAFLLSADAGAVRRRHRNSGGPGRGAVIPASPVRPDPVREDAQARPLAFVKTQEGGSHTSPPCTTDLRRRLRDRRRRAPVHLAPDLLARRPPAASPSGPRGRRPAPGPGRWCRRPPRAAGAAGRRWRRRPPPGRSRPPRHLRPRRTASAARPDSRCARPRW